MVLAPNQFGLPPIHGVYPFFLSDQGVGHTCMSIMEGMAAAGATISLTALAKHKAVSAPYVSSVVPRHLLKYLGNFDLKSLVNARSRMRVRSGDIAYLWVDSSAEATERMRSRGAFVVREMINCAFPRRGRELDRAAELLGWPSTSDATSENIERERAALLAADAVFCPSPYVRESVLECGVAPSACIDTSYGWSPSRLPLAPAPRRDDGEFVVLFVGTLDVRKGTPWLLEAWKMARLKHARLLLAGRLYPEIETRCADLLTTPGVEVLGHVGNIADLYSRADAFVLPTWEEGCSLVTLEAMAYGLPCILTPMGTGGVATESESLIVPPGNAEALAEAFVRMQQNVDERRAMGESSRRRAADYTWQKVSARRLAQLAHIRRPELSGAALQSDAARG